ncbi:MAG: polysaccharide biosynthesis tyrosine autokinase [Planctomycetota bacterium]|nr:polysaccharide biosynthesis tyrosine autokinase [Planctomycetota bacterium]
MSEIPTRSQAAQITRAPQGAIRRGAAPGGAAAGLTGRDVLRIVRKRKWWIILSVLISSAITTAVTLLWSLYAPFYTTSAYVEVNPPTRGALAGAPGLYGKDIMDRLVMDHSRMVKRQNVLDRAAKSERMTNTAWYRKDPGGVINRLIDKIGVSPVANTNFIQISMTGTAPDDQDKVELAEIVTAVAEAFVHDTRVIATEGLLTQMEQLTSERGNYQTDLDAVRRDMAEARPADIPIIQERRNVLTIKLQVLTTQLTQLELAKVQAQAALEAVLKQEADGVLGQSSEVLIAMDADPTLRALRAAEVNLATERDNLLRKFGPKHRTVENFETRLASLRKEISDREKELLQIQISALKEIRAANLAATDFQLNEVQLKYKEATAGAKDLEALLARLAEYEVREKALTDNIKRLNNRLLELRLMWLNEEPLTLRSPATKPRFPSMPKWGIMMPLGVILGLVVGLGLAFALELMDTSIKSPMDVSRRVDLPVLGMVPHIDDLDEEIDNLYLAFRSSSPGSLLMESFRQIRTCLLFSGPASQRRRLLITSPLPEDGRTVVALNLAAAIARGGRKVLVVDANFRQPMIHKIFTEHAGGGLSSSLVGQSDWRDSVQQVEPNLAVMPAGPLPPNPAELLGSEQMQQLTTEMVSEYDQVIFDGPPCLVVTDAPIVSTIMDGVVLVVRAGANTTGIVQRTRDTLARIGTHVLGVVLNGTRATAGGYFRKSYDQFYEYQSQSRLPAEPQEQSPPDGKLPSAPAPSP